MPAPAITKSIQTNATHIAESLQQCSTLDDVYALIPLTCRMDLTLLLQSLFTHSVKAAHVRSVLTSLRLHKTNGSFPSYILGAVKTPAVQLTKEFCAIPSYHTRNNEMEAEVSKARK